MENKLFFQPITVNILSLRRNKIYYPKSAFQKGFVSIVESKRKSIRIFHLLVMKILFLKLMFLETLIRLKLIMIITMKLIELALITKCHILKHSHCSVLLICVQISWPVLATVWSSLY